MILFSFAIYLLIALFVFLISKPSADVSKTNPVRSSFRKRKDINYKETSSVGSSM